MRSHSIVVAAALVGHLMGCATAPPPVPTSQDTEAFASRMIADKVSVAADAQREWVALINEDKAIKKRKQAALETDEVDVDYIGKPQELLQTFAYRYGYRYSENGKKTRLRTVNIRMKKVLPLEVLQNIGYQLGKAANVVLDKNDKILRLTYKKTTGIRG